MHASINIIHIAFLCFYYNNPQRCGTMSVYKILISSRFHNTEIKMNNNFKGFQGKDAEANLPRTQTRKTQISFLHPFSHSVDHTNPNYAMHFLTFHHLRSVIN